MYITPKKVSYKFFSCFFFFGRKRNVSDFNTHKAYVLQIIIQIVHNKDRPLLSRFTVFEEQFELASTSNTRRSNF